MRRAVRRPATGGAGTRGASTSQAATASRPRGVACSWDASGGKSWGPGAAPRERRSARQGLHVDCEQRDGLAGVKAHGDDQQATQALKRGQGYRWASMGCGCLVGGMVVLVVVCDGHWLRSAVARQARATLSRTAVGGRWTPTTVLLRPRVVQAQLAVLDWSWSGVMWCGRRARPLAARWWLRALEVDSELDTPDSGRAGAGGECGLEHRAQMIDIRPVPDLPRIDLQALLQGRLVLLDDRAGRARGPTEDLQAGGANWHSAAEPAVEQTRHSTRRRPYSNPSPEPSEGSVTHAADAASTTRLTVTLAEVQATMTGPEQRLDVEGAGQVAALPFLFTGHGGAFQDLMIQAISGAHAAGRRSVAGRLHRHGGAALAASGRGGGGVPGAGVPGAALRQPGGTVDRRRRTRRRIDSRAI